MGETIQLEDCLGERFIGAGASDARIEIEGIPGNALGAYLDGACIEVFGNAQDAVGDTMNDGRIIIHGNVGDTAGYAMRGGEIYVKGDAGYRAGVHMKEYGDKRPVMVIGGCTGSFLGEYQAGGLIIVLGLGAGRKGRPIVSNFPCTGMHGGMVVLKGDAVQAGILFPPQVDVQVVDAADCALIAPFVRNYALFFGADGDDILQGPFTLVTPLSHNPYTRLYVAN